MGFPAPTGQEPSEKEEVINTWSLGFFDYGGWMTEPIYTEENNPEKCLLENSREHFQDEENAMMSPYN